MVNTDYEIVLKEYLQLSPAHVENIMKLYTSAYMDSWLPEDSKKRIYAMLDDAGLVQEVRSSVSKNYAGVKFTDTETPVVYYNQISTVVGQIRIMLVNQYLNPDVALHL